MAGDSGDDSGDDSGEERDFYCDIWALWHKQRPEHSAVIDKFDWRLIKDTVEVCCRALAARAAAGGARNRRGALAVTRRARRASVQEIGRWEDNTYPLALEKLLADPARAHPATSDARGDE